MNDYRKVAAVVALALLIQLGGGCKIVDDGAQESEGNKELRIDPDALPLNVEAAAKGQIPNGTITRATKETRNRRQVFVLDVEDKEKMYELIVTPDGQVLSQRAAKP